MTEAELRKFISEGVDRAKGGDAVSIYRSLQQYMAAGSVPQKSHYGIGWIIYYALHQSADSEIDARKRMLAAYLKLSVPRPHKLHSMILTEAIRLYKNTRNAAFNNRTDTAPSFSIIKFTDLWDTANLRPGDWRRKKLEEKDLTSTVEKLITVCVNELEDLKCAPSSQFIEVIERALQEFPDSFNLMAQRAKIYRLADDSDRAADLLRRALLLAPGKFFLWSDLAELTDVNENPRLKVALLSKALSAPGPEQFKGRIRLSLAEVWCNYGTLSKALWELERVKQIYTSCQWHLPALYTRLMKEIPEGTLPENPAESYRRLLPLADKEIYSILPAIDVRKTYHKVPTPAEETRFGAKGDRGISWRVTDTEGRNYWFQPSRFNIDPNYPGNPRLRIRLHSNRVVHAELIED